MLRRRSPTTPVSAPRTFATRRRTWRRTPRPTMRPPWLRRTRQPAPDRRREPRRRLDHRVVPDAVEHFDDDVGARVAETVRHRHHRDRIVDAPHDVERRRVRLDRTRVARLVSPTLLDVADESWEQPVTVGPGDQLPLCDELVVGHRRPA